jgi:hypothetical protein
MGLLGCDNRFAYIIKEALYNITNPSKTIKSHHLHKSRVKTYKTLNRVTRPYYTMPPSFLE